MDQGPEAVVGGEGEVEVVVGDDPGVEDVVVAGLAGSVVMPPGLVEAGVGTVVVVESGEVASGAAT